MDLVQYLSTLGLSTELFQDYHSQCRSMAMALANQSGCLEGQPEQSITIDRIKDAVKDCGFVVVPDVFLDWLGTF